MLRHSALIALLLIAQPGSLWADQDERAASVTAGFATFSIPDHSPNGGALGLEYEHRISTSIAARVSGGGGVYSEDGLAYSGQAVVGISYLFDVLKYVPYINVGIGGMVLGGDNLETDLSPLVELGVGLDILHSRRFSYGVQARFESFLDNTAFFTAGLRASWRWGFF